MVLKQPIPSSSSGRLRHRDARLSASGTITLSGQPGDRFLLLRAPAVLTRFEGEGLRLTKREVPGEGLTYIISIPVTEETPALDEDAEPVAAAVDYEATFELSAGSTQANGRHARAHRHCGVQEINLSYDEAGWDVLSPTAVRVESVDSCRSDAGQSAAWSWKSESFSQTQSP